MPKANKRASSLAAERFFRKAQRKVSAGDYDFAVDAKAARERNVRE